MTPRIRPFALVVALSALLAGVPASAAVIGVQMFVNGDLVATESVEPDPNGAVPLEFDAAAAGYAIEGSALLDIDPFIDFSFSAFNFSENAQFFEFIFTSPYTGGPYDTLLHEFSSTVTDLDENGAAALAPVDASGFISIPQLDGSPVVAAGLGSGCTPVIAPGATVTCDPFASTSVSVVTLADGDFGAVISFFLSGGDAMSGVGRVELVNAQVPAPAALLLLGLGVVTALGRRSLSRYRR